MRDHRKRLGFEQEVLLHCPHFPDYAPTNFHIFCSLDSQLCGLVFDTNQRKHNVGGQF